MGWQDPELEKRLDGWVEEHRAAFVADVLGALRFRSVARYDHPTYPFGEGCAQMLDYMQCATEGYGFSFTNHQYYCGSCLIPGKKGGRTIGLLGHTDVVPENGDWSFDPYAGIERDGYLLGRGSNDNKGSTFAAIYAVRALLDCGAPLQSDVRLMFGCNEEDGMKDMAYLGGQIDFPDVTLVPDSWWGADVAEPGVVNITLRANLGGSNLLAFEAGDSNNSIPSHGTAELGGVTLAQARAAMDGCEGITLCQTERGVRLTAKGIGKHAAFPRGSVNAIALLARALRHSGLLQNDAGAMGFLADTLADYDGRAVGFHASDDFYGTTNHTCCMVRLENGWLRMWFNLRYPACLDPAAVYPVIEAYFAATGYEMQENRHKLPMKLDSAHPVVRILCETASRVLQEDQRPFAQNGGTYGSVVPRAFPAGPAVHSRPQALFPDGRGGAHQPDECFETELLLKAIKIYALAVLQTDQWLQGA